MSGPVPREESPGRMPAEVLLAGDGLGWQGVATHACRCRGPGAIVPATRDFVLVGYRTGVASVQGRAEARRTGGTPGPGALSLPTRARRAFRVWHDPIDVTHLYLSGALVSEVAGEVMDRAIGEVTFDDVLRIEEPLVTAALGTIAREIRSGELGGALYVDTVTRALIIHLLRRHASVRAARAAPDGALSPRQRRRIVELIEEGLGDRLDLRGMADALGLTPCRFARAFRRSFGKPPYAFVTARRLERARRLLAGTDLPIKAVAADCGFADQSHLTRMFSSAYGETPAAFRRRAR